MLNYKFASTRTGPMNRTCEKRMPTNGRTKTQTYAEEERGGKVACWHALGSHVRALNDPLLAGLGSEHREGESGAGVGHGESGRASAGLRLNHFGAGVLDALAQRLQLLPAELDTWRDLRQEGNDGVARVAANDGHRGLGHVEAL